MSFRIFACASRALRIRVLWPSLICVVWFNSCACKRIVAVISSIRSAVISTEVESAEACLLRCRSNLSVTSVD